MKWSRHLAYLGYFDPSGDGPHALSFRILAPQEPMVHNLALRPSSPA